MESAPILRPSPRKSPFQPPYERELHINSTSSDEDPYSYDVSPDEAVFDEDDQDSSQESQSSHTSDDDLISEFPGDGDSRAPSTIYTPHKRRSPFRHPSSVRNLQLDTTPPHLASPIKDAYHLSPSPHSRNSTPRSVYSTHSRPRSTRSSPSRKDKTKKQKKERPLVLLHFTLLPYRLPYPQGLLESVLPASKLADGKLLKEKLGQSVVQERGVLIPHPREDYDLLEERLLEALELEQGTLTRDGHFVIPEERGISRASRSFANTRHEDEDEDPTTEHGNADDEEKTEMGDEASQHLHLCEDCGKELHIVGEDRRWDIKVYAANGLMREGAWGAAWHEMERVDVEIQPFINDETKRELEIRMEEMDLLLQAEQRDSAARHHEAAAVEVLHLANDTPRTHRDSGLDAQRMKEIYGEETQEHVKDDIFEGSAETPRKSSEGRPPRTSSGEVPLSTLLSNYVQLIFQDRRNIAIGFLTVITLLLAMIAGQSKQIPPSVASNTHAEASAGLASAMSSSVPTQITKSAASVANFVPTPSAKSASAMLSSAVSSPVSIVEDVKDSIAETVESVLPQKPHDEATDRRDDISDAQGDSTLLPADGNEERAANLELFASDVDSEESSPGRLDEGSGS